VRDYVVAQLTALGLQPQVQRAIGFRAEIGTVASIENVLVRLPSTAPSRAVLILAHSQAETMTIRKNDQGLWNFTCLSTGDSTGSVIVLTPINPQPPLIERGSAIAEGQPDSSGKQ